MFRWSSGASTLEGPALQALGFPAARSILLHWRVGVPDVAPWPAEAIIAIAKGPKVPYETGYV